MVERKRGIKDGNAEAKAEAIELEGVSWASWKPVLQNKLETSGLTLPDGESEEFLHNLFILRRRRKLGQITIEEMHGKLDELVKGKDELLENDVMVVSIKYITDKIGSLNP
ncbi:MAG: hypothetical protein ABSC49_03105 [Candidatus Microgenomates bacterium]|jgi:hypothetical protein